MRSASGPITQPKWWHDLSVANPSQSDANNLAIPLRSLQLAALNAPALVRIGDVARIHNLSGPHIMKIVHELGKAGYLETVRGRSGGFRLAHTPKDIVVGEVIRITKGRLDVVDV